MMIEGWLKFTKSQQIGAIAAELARAKMWQEKDRTNFLSAIERTINLIDFTIEDKRWRNQLSILLWLRDEMAKFYIGATEEKIDSLYNAL